MISLKSLLSIADMIAEKGKERNGFLSSADFDVLSRQRSLQHILGKEGLGWIWPELDGFCLTDSFNKFVSSWNEGNLLGMSESLVAYPIYSRFLCHLRQEPICIPPRKNRRATQLSPVAINAFYTWSVGTGQGYISLDGVLYWGGEQPTLEDFVYALYEEWEKANKTSGYANIGRVADMVCRRLHISFQTFESKMREAVNQRWHIFVLAPATIRPPSTRFQIAFVRPRSEIIQERHHAQLLNRPFKPTWIDYRYVEDGIIISNERLKLIKWLRIPVF